MQKLPTLIALILLSCHVNATVRTVNPNIPGPGQFTTLDAAILASANNDTIYLSAGSHSSAFNSKKLVFIGTGHNPDKQSPTICSVPWIDSNPGCQGSKFIGITFVNTSVIGSSSPLSGNLNLEYINCRFTGTFNAFQFGSASAVSGITFRGCIFTCRETFVCFFSGLSLTFSASNCIFAPVATGIHCLSGSNITLSGTLTNCQFQHSNSILLAAAASSLIVSNSIFYGVQPHISSSTSNSATKCLSFNNSNNAFATWTIVSGNLVGINPQFTTNPPTTLPVFSYSDNYRLGVSSPGKNYGTDGKDIGVYGGTFNFTMTGEPATIPVIRAMNLQGSTTVPAGTPINVNVISTVKP